MDKIVLLVASGDVIAILTYWRPSEGRRQGSRGARRRSAVIGVWWRVWTPSAACETRAPYTRTTAAGACTPDRWSEL